MSNEWEYSFTWRIENYSSICCEKGERLESPFFVVKSLIGCKWCLWIYPKGYSKSKGYFSCFLAMTRHKEEEPIIDYEIKIMNAISETLGISDIKGKKFDKSIKSWGWYDMIEIGHLKEEMKKSLEDTLILSCSINSKLKGKLLPETGEARTRMKAEKHSFDWIIRVFPLNQYAKGKKFLYLETTLYRLSVSFEEDGLEVNVSRMTNDISPSRPIFGKIALLDVKGKEAISKTATHTFGSKMENDVWKFPSLITKKQFFGNMCEYVENEKMVLVCEFSVLQKIEFVTVENTNFGTSTDIDSLISLRDDFQKLFIEKTNADVKLRVGDNVEIQAHRSVLVARSPVFSAMFDRDMLENRTGVINIEDVDADSLVTFVEFLYTGVVTFKDWKSASTLMVVADKYQVSSLKVKCSQYLISSLSVDNVCEVLVLADILGHKMLKETSLDFAANHASDIFALPDYSSWIQENPKLSAELITYMGKVLKEHK